jgi:hypothetical protein
MKAYVRSTGVQENLQASDIKMEKSMGSEFMPTLASSYMTKIVDSSMLASSRASLLLKIHLTKLKPVDQFYQSLQIQEDKCSIGTQTQMREILEPQYIGYGAR